MMPTSKAGLWLLALGIAVAVALGLSLSGIGDCC